MCIPLSRGAARKRFHTMDNDLKNKKQIPGHIPGTAVLYSEVSCHTSKYDYTKHFVHFFLFFQF